MMNKVYILGGVQTDYQRNWSKEGKNVLALLRENVLPMYVGHDIDEELSLVEFDEIKKYNW